MSLTQNQWVAVIVAIVVVAGLLLFRNPLQSFFTMDQTNNQNTVGTVDKNVPPASLDLKVVDTKLGTGAEAVPGKEVTVHYTGTLADGSKFDSSLDRNEPFSFTIGAGQVIKGWELGLVGMKVGGKRTLTIPSDLAYGDSGFPPVIPAKATLTFDIELLGVK